MNRLHILRILKKIIKKSPRKDAKTIIVLLKKNMRKTKNKPRTRYKTKNKPRTTRKLRRKKKRSKQCSNKRRSKRKQRSTKQRSK